MENQDFDVWLPPKNAGDNHDTNSYLHKVFSSIASMPRNEVYSVVQNLINIGFIYHAARCLEITAQHSLGVFFTGKELISYRYPDFGNFHNDIKTLLEAGCLYIQGNRERTAFIAFNRALSFVEEALRQIESYEEENPKDLLCLGIAFELAGHCCFPLGNKDGFDYYKAAEKYWYLGYENDPEESEKWKDNKATKIVMDCLKEVAKIKVAEKTSMIPLMSSDYQVRISKAKEFMS